MGAEALSLFLSFILHLSSFFSGLRLWQGHGTHCAGTVGGILSGVAKKVGLVSVKVLSDQGSGSYSGIINGINWVIDQVQSTGRRGIMSLSLGGGKSNALNSAIANAVDAYDIPVIVAAGNSNNDACN